MKLKSLLFPVITVLLTPLFIYSQNDSMKKDWANLKKYNSDNIEVMSSTPTSKKIVLMGDSITEFWKINDPDFFIKNIINRGISGQTTPQMLLRFRQDVINLKPEATVLLAGINDIAENTGPISNEGILDNIISMVELAKANNIKVILCSVLPANRFNWNPTIFPAERVIQLNELIKNYAKKNKITYIDYYSAMVDSEKGLQKKYGEDGVHPNFEGYLIMKSILNKALKLIIE